MPNPYLTANNEPQLKASVFCFLDVLGYKEFAGAELSEEEMAARLAHLHQALTSSSAILIDAERQVWYRDLNGVDDAAVKAFTDNIVIGLPIDDDGELETGLAFERIGTFQLEMVLAGFFVRGAISFGPVFIDELAVFGAPLIEAAKGEAALAHVPRVVLTKSGRALVEKHLAYYGNGAHAPQAVDLKQDQDQAWFVDYLVNLVSEPAEPIIDLTRLGTHGEVVAAKLAEHATNPRVWDKYEWVARYHNWFCETWHVPGEYRIEIDALRGPIREIVADLPQPKPVDLADAVAAHFGATVSD